jgi:exonuclease SbcC
VQTATSRHADATRKKEDDEREYTTYIAQYPIDESTPVILQLDERIRQSKAKGEKLQQQIGEINATLKQNADNCDKIADLHKKMQQLEGPKAMWNKLCKNLALGDNDGKYFRTIAQSYVLSSLVNAANRYLAILTNSRYRLTITLGSFLILIEDAENAYTKRSTGTISGGESFLVSLSLALALSDIGTLSVDTLFIDEGFGSLSGEALDNAINTLYSLHRTCGRKVGIISHIEELRERIPVKIQVEQEANLSSSKITIVS